VQIAEARKNAYEPVELVSRASEPEVVRWSRRSRVLFIIAAATLCWAIHGAALYLVLGS